MSFKAKFKKALRFQDIDGVRKPGSRVVNVNALDRIVYVKKLECPELCTEMNGQYRVWGRGLFTFVNSGPKPMRLFLAFLRKARRSPDLWSVFFTIPT